MTKAERSKRIIAAFSCAHRRRGRVAGDGDEGVVEARAARSTALDAGAAVDQRLEQRLEAALGKLEHPFVALAARVGRQGARARGRRLARVRRRTIGRSRARASSTRPSNATLPSAMIAIRSHSRSAWAMTWVEKMIVAPAAASRADQLLEPALVDRVEAGEGLVEHDQPRPVDDGAEQLDGLRHALGQAPDRLVRQIAEAVLARAARRRGGGLRASGRPRSAPMKAIASRASSPDRGRAPRADSRPPAPPRAGVRGRAGGACRSTGR